ncbi:hypothetical protein [Actinomycetospora cinnamomea]|uniref:MmpS family membrane protein n=1 Tax=Actinomycetospora cinnamomea TaxID=663609 RepID=A0A2U1F412_9PSEU|nr:hypothetical protein [Actinomycetospora cinnamomea]PVZ06889.1 hypothetical protein C8D89_11282 [Actinomycetospora cinnamomea]
MDTSQGTSPGTRPRHRGMIALAPVAAAVLSLSGCAGPSAPTEPLDMVEFSAEGTDGAAFGSYVLVGDLLSTSARTFTGLPFSARLPAPGTVSPKMSVSVVDLPPNSRVTCRIALNGRILVENTGDVPGRDVVCTAGTTTP